MLRTILVTLLLATSSATFVAPAPVRAASFPTHCVGCDMARVDLHGANLRGAKYVGTDLEQANLRGADLRDAELVGCDLSGADLRSADLRGANLTGADLVGARLTGAQLGSARFVGTDLRRGDVRGANFDGSDLIGTNLRDGRADGASFRGARICFQGDGTPHCLDLRGASVTHADFRGALFCDAARFGHRTCRPVDAATLKTLSHNDLNGALVP